MLMKVGLFVSVYLLTSLLIVPPLAKYFGRTPLPYFHARLQPLNYASCLFNRHYVRVELYDLLMTTTDKLNAQYPETAIAYMDANFPFINGFPLFPHLSHNDGRKVDLAFLYRDKQSKKPLIRTAKSWIGYGGSEQPLTEKENMPEICAKGGYWQYGLLTQLTPSFFPATIELDVERTKHLLKLFAQHPQTGKIFIEPYLKQRWGLGVYGKIRFHGCQAVRHDDHIHLQL